MLQKPDYITRPIPPRASSFLAHLLPLIWPKLGANFPKAPYHRSLFLGAAPPPSPKQPLKPVLPDDLVLCRFFCGSRLSPALLRFSP